MLEILAIMYLCGKVKSNVLERGRKPLGFTVLTVVLWVTFEFTGATMAIMLGFDDNLLFYVIALIFMVMGGYFAYFISINCKFGNYVPVYNRPIPGVHQLSAPAPVEIIRSKSAIGGSVQYGFILNGTNIGKLKNNQTMNGTTNYVQNIIVAIDKYSNATPPVYFAVIPGQTARIHFKSGKFVTKKFQSCLPLSKQDVAKLY